jgi:hypothetical protein
LKNHPQNTRRSVLRSLILVLALMAFINSTYGQAEVEPWGNITGIRHKGQLYEFESGIRIQRGNDFTSTGQERQHPHYKRVGDEQIINTNIDSLFIDETVEDEGGDKVKVTITLNAHADYNFDGAFFTVQLPHTGFADGKQRLDGGPAGSKQYAPAGQNFDGTVKGAQFKSSTMDISVNFDDGPAVVRIRKDISSTGDPQLYVAMKQNGMSKGEVIQKTFIIKASGDVDHEPVNLAINTSRQGREFDGLGGWPTEGLNCPGVFGSPVNTSTQLPPPIQAS